MKKAVRLIRGTANYVEKKYGAIKETKGKQERRKFKKRKKERKIKRKKEK